MNAIDEGKKYVMNTYNRFPLVLTKGEGVYVWDENGKKYLDFVAGIAVNSLGHNHKKLSDAIIKQAQNLMHVSNLYYTSPQIQLAKKLVENSCFDKVFFCNSGAEAIEGSLKLARKYAVMKNTEKFEIITMKNSFHGRTYGAITATGQEKYQKGLGPLLPGIKHVEYNNIVDLKNNITEKTGAILLEVIQGEGGIKSVTKEYLQGVRKICDQKDIMLIFDEIQCGIGRLGTLFAYQSFGVEPDVVTIAKGMAGGVPAGAILAKESFAIAFNPGDHASTFGGNPLATAAGNVVIDELLDNNLLENIKENGKYLEEKLNQLKEKHDVINEIRGMGFLQGIELKIEVGNIIKNCMENGLLLVNAGTHVIRFVPPLIATKENINEAIDILDKSLSLVENKN